MAVKPTVTLKQLTRMVSVSEVCRSLVDGRRGGGMMSGVSGVYEVLTFDVARCCKQAVWRVKALSCSTR